MALITRIRKLNNAGVLANVAVKDTIPTFLRYNLIYGFNGSGKSTLSRAFACLQSGKPHRLLPDRCGFEVELSDGSVFGIPEKPTGLEERVCVFNSDFIENNLRWAEGTANSIFYISQEQAEAAAELRAAQGELPAVEATRSGAEGVLRASTQALASLKRDRARLVAARLHLPNRKYEAPQLQGDYESMRYDKASVLESAALDELEEMARRSSPPRRATAINIKVEDIAGTIGRVEEMASKNVGDGMLAELQAHPEMVPWAKTGHEYHARHDLASCLFCGQKLTEERRSLLAEAFNDSLARFIAELVFAQSAANATFNSLALAVRQADETVLMPDFQASLASAKLEAQAAADDLFELREPVLTTYQSKRSAPTTVVATRFPSSQVLSAMCQRTSEAIDKINALIEQHNQAVTDFDAHQSSARDGIKRHFLAEGHDEYEAAKSAVERDTATLKSAASAAATMQARIITLRNKVLSHGPAAEQITKLVRQYLAHGELTVVAATEGYELRRHDQLVKGPPSEGEKTALALCYFLSTLGANGRKLKDLIVVVDDPISSLDTKALNYACALIRTKLRDAAQLFVLTHNHHCMNEFKKDWKPLAKPKNEKKTQPTARFLYLDVKMLDGAKSRSTSIVEMSSLLSEYDSEYHFLCSKVLQFEAAAESHSDYGFLMPNVIRRVLEVFLAFKVPGTSPIKDRLARLVGEFPTLDATRMAALDRLAQVESHSDSLDDLVAQSPMTIEETRDANAALLALMSAADQKHTAAIRKQCG